MSKLTDYLWIQSTKANSMHSREPQVKKHVYEFLSSIFLVSDIIFAALLVMARRTRTYYYHSYGQLDLAHAASQY